MCSRSGSDIRESKLNDLSTIYEVRLLKGLASEGATYLIVETSVEARTIPSLEGSVSEIDTEGSDGIGEPFDPCLDEGVDLDEEDIRTCLRAESLTYGPNMLFDDAHPTGQMCISTAHD
ncbi:hypothetical protein B296_00040773 [Ensete ventricosum]|uniref:Uncharacterized protein n=1 Tax=Ensete ventricosum TaxID=4639 RepID=A0A426ZPA5_ENSVE|nr:hypothetical protein B296_00040773 [Ensete ventricosum]